MKKVVCLLLALVMLFSLAACGKEPAAPATPAEPADPAAPAEPAAPADHGFDISKVDTSDWVQLELSYATYLAAENPIGALCFESWEAKLEELMPGWIELVIYPSGTLLAQADIFEGVESGVADMGMVDVSSVKELLPVCALWALPGTQATATTSGTAAMQEWVTRVQPAELDNVVVLHAQGNQAGQMVTSFQWDSVDDLAGKQLRATAAFSDIVTSLGATPVSVATSEMYEAARSGLIEGAYYTITANTINGSHEFMKYGTFTNMCTSPYLYVMNRDTFERMPETQQEFFLEAFEQAFWELIVPKLPEIGDIHEATQRAIEAGDYIVYELPEETLADVHARCEHITADYIAANSHVEGMQEAYDVLVEMTTKWNEWFPMEKYTGPFFTSAEKGFDYVLEHLDDYRPDPLPEIYGYIPLDQR